MQDIVLRMPPEFRFEAGQYLSVAADQNTTIPLSIASAPGALPLLHLRFQPDPEDPLAAAMQQALTHSEIDVSPAMGDVRAGDPDVPLFVVAGGSGIAQAMSCARHRHDIGAQAPTTVVWCADETTHTRGADRFDTLDRTRLEVCVDATRDASNRGMTWLRTHAGEHTDAHVVLAGSPGFVYLVFDLLVAMGFSATQMASDVFAYAPRDPQTAP